MTLARGRRLATLGLLLWPGAAMATGSTAAGDYPVVTSHGGSIVRAGFAAFKSTLAAWVRAVFFRWSKSGSTSRVDERIGRSAVCTVRFSRLQ